MKGAIMTADFFKKCSLGALKDWKAEIECGIIRSEANEDLRKYRKFKDDLDLVNAEIALREKETH
jgi:hypothetical protein